MKEFAFQVAGLLVLIFGGMWVMLNPSLSGNTFLRPGTINGNQAANTGGQKIAIVSEDGSQTKATLSIEVADTPEKRGSGLGGRTSLGQDTGMLFIFSQPGTYDFWMKGMLIPIDFIWIYGDEIVDIKSDAPPPASGQTELPLFRANQPIDKVLEVNAGYAKKHNIVPGDRIRQLN